MAGRIKKVGPLEFQEAASNQASSASVEGDIGKALKTEPIVKDPTLEPWMSRIEEQIERNGLKDAPDLKDRLMVQLAWTMRHGEFSGLASNIFGTQVAALKEMDASGPLTMEALQKIYHEHTDRILSDGTHSDPLDFLRWIAFLRDNALITMNDKGQYATTPIGKIFIQFLANSSITEAKMY